MARQTETAMATAFAKAGFNAAEYRLRMLATDALKKHHGNIPRALKTFERSIDGDITLIRESLLSYLKSLPAGGQFAVDAHGNPAPGRHPNGERDHLRVANQTEDVAAPSRGGAGQPIADAQSRGASPIREPSQQQRAAAATVAQKISVLNTFKIAGTAIGDWLVISAKGEGMHMEFHGRVLRELADQAERSIANIENWMTFRDVLTEQQVQQCIQRASGLPNAA